MALVALDAAAVYCVATWKILTKQDVGSTSPLVICKRFMACHWFGAARTQCTPRCLEVALNISLMSATSILSPIASVEKLFCEFAVAVVGPFDGNRRGVKLKVITNSFFDFAQCGLVREHLTSLEQRNLADVGMLYCCRRCDDADLELDIVCASTDELPRLYLCLQRKILERSSSEDNNQDITKA